MRLLLVVLPVWRAITAWLVAICTPASLLREMAEMPYRGAPVILVGKGLVKAKPAQTLREAARNRRRLAEAMAHERP